MLMLLDFRSAPHALRAFFRSQALRVVQRALVCPAKNALRHPHLQQATASNVLPANTLWVVPCSASCAQRVNILQLLRLPSAKYVRPANSLKQAHRVAQNATARPVRRALRLLLPRRATASSALPVNFRLAKQFCVKIVLRRLSHRRRVVLNVRLVQRVNTHLPAL